MLVTQGSKRLNAGQKAFLKCILNVKDKSMKGIAEILKQKHNKGTKQLVSNVLSERSDKNSEIVVKEILSLCDIDMDFFGHIGDDWFTEWLNIINFVYSHREILPQTLKNVNQQKNKKINKRNNRMNTRGLIDYLDFKQAVEIDLQGGVKIEVSTLDADGIQELITRLLEREGFEELEKGCANNMFFVNTGRLQILRVEFVGCSKRFKEIKCGGAPIFRITLKEYSEEEKFQGDMDMEVKNDGNK